jgi:hypothetical protein
VFFIHIEICCSGEKSNSMPLPSAQLLPVHQPGLLFLLRRRHFDREHRTPDLVAISSG